MKKNELEKKIIDLEQERLYLLRRLGTLQNENKELRIELRTIRTSTFYRGYEQGWKDATKKIRNFIIRHCEEYEDGSDGELWEKERKKFESEKK